MRPTLPPPSHPTIKSPASDPWNTEFDWVVALSSVSVMRIGITVPEGRVTVLATGGGGGGGAAAPPAPALEQERLPPEEAEVEEARSAPLPAYAAALAYGGGRRLSRAYRSHHQVIDHRSYPIDRSAIGSSQRAGSVVVYLAIQRSHTIGHGHLNVLTRQRRLTRDLGLDISCQSADRLVPEAGAGCAACVLPARAVLHLGTGCSYIPTPEPANRSKLPAEYCVALQNQSSWGKSSILDFRFACFPFGRRETSTGWHAAARIMHPIHCIGLGIPLTAVYYRSRGIRVLNPPGHAKQYDGTLAQLDKGKIHVRRKSGQRQRRKWFRLVSGRTRNWRGDRCALCSPGGNRYTRELSPRARVNAPST